MITDDERQRFYELAKKIQSENPDKVISFHEYENGMSIDVRPRFQSKTEFWTYELDNKILKAKVMAYIRLYRSLLGVDESCCLEL